ncbi:MAG: hypothetical protein R3F35_09710 [Myxococcota bacterium]
MYAAPVRACGRGPALQRGGPFGDDDEDGRGEGPLPGDRRRTRSRRRSASVLLTALFALAAGSGCLSRYRKAVVADDALLEPLGGTAVRLPTPADLAAARLARAALVSSSRREVAHPDDAIEAAARHHADTDEGGSPGARTPAVDAAFAALEQAPKRPEEKRLVLLATDLRNATLDDPIADRDASRSLRRRFGIDPRLATRLDEVIATDPLAQARSRKRDDWHRLFARTFNSVSQPLGQSVITGFFLAPYQLANSVIHYFAGFSNSEPLSTTGRQALVLREAFLAAHPTSPVAPRVAELVARDRVRLEKTLAKRRIRSAETALEQGEPGLASHHAAQAVALLASHPDRNARTRRRAERLERRAKSDLAARDRLDARSLEALATDPATRESERALATALLVRPLVPGALDVELAEYAAAAGRGAGGSRRGAASRVRFVRATTQHESGHEEPARHALAVLAASDDAPMARHARQIVDDGWQNPWDAYLRLRRAGRRRELAYRFAGEWVSRPRYPNLWPPVAYLIDTPTIAMTIVMAPVRALIAPFTGLPDFQRASALAGYRYLLRYPEGDHQRDLVDWLYAYELDQDRPGRALRLADLIPDFPPKARAKLVEGAAEDQLKSLDRLDRRDQRASVLRGVATEFPDSEGGRDAGQKAREELSNASPQNIRITRGFLLENPAVAGERGLGLAPRLLDGDPRDGELHAEGVVLRGGRVLEIRLRDEGRDEDAPPVSRMHKISKRRLSRLAAALDEAVQRNGLVDPGARFAPDANRETYLEQARLGLTEEADLRPSAESSFVYQSLRERYGAVRGRDSLLPFDLVFRGSLGDFSLGAFPRWRAPAETDDAFLYR